jgi:hypothetical protein
MERELWKTGEAPGEVRLRFGRVGEGPDPVLVLHGITAQHRSFNAVARHLESSGGIVGLDLRGRGDSGKPPKGSYGLEAHARDVVRTLDHLGVERGVICGHLEQTRGVACPVALARAAGGFFPGSAPLISDDTLDAMAGTLDLREEIFLDGATHYTLLFSEHTRKWVHLLRGGDW